MDQAQLFPKEISFFPPLVSFFWTDLFKYIFFSVGMILKLCCTLPFLLWCLFGCFYLYILQNSVKYLVIMMINFPHVFQTTFSNPLAKLKKVHWWFAGFFGMTFWTETNLLMNTEQNLSRHCAVFSPCARPTSWISFTSPLFHYYSSSFSSMNVILILTKSCDRSLLTNEFISLFIIVSIPEN